MQEELHRIKALYDESLEEDASLQEVMEEETKVKTEAKEKKSRILDNPSYKAMFDQIKELQQEIKDNKEALSQELVEYYKESGEMEIEDHEGNVKHMKFSVRLVN